MNEIFKELKNELNASRKIVDKWTSRNERCIPLLNYCVDALKEAKEVFSNLSKLIGDYSEFGYRNTGLTSLRVFGGNVPFGKAEVFRCWDTYEETKFLFDARGPKPLGAEDTIFTVSIYEKGKDKYWSITYESINDKLKEIECVIRNLSSVNLSGNTYSLENCKCMKSRAEELRKILKHVLFALQIELKKKKESTEILQEEYNKFMGKKDEEYVRVSDGYFG